VAARFDFPLRETVLRRTLEALCQRHEILRTSYRHLSETVTPSQVIQEAWAPEIEAATWADASEVTVVLTHWFDEKRGQWDTSGGGLCAVAGALRDGGFVLGLSLPAMSADTKTLVLLVETVAEIYAGLLGGSDLADLIGEDEETLQYADVGEVFHDLLVSEESAEGRDWWQHRQVTPSYQIPNPMRCCRDIQLDSALDSQTDWLAAFAILLQRMGEEPTIAVAFDGRTFEELAQSPGLFARFLPVTLQPDSDAGFGDWKARVNAALQEIALFQDTFCWEALKQGKSAEPGFRFGFEFADLRLQDQQTVTILHAAAPTDVQPLCLKVYRMDRGVKAVLSFDPDLYSEREAEALNDRLMTLLGAAEEETPVGELPLLGGEERRRLLETFNQTDQIPSASIHAYQLIAEKIASQPEEPALVTDAGHWTFAELGRRVNELAAFLQQRVGPDVRVAFCCERSPEMVLAMLAISAAGGTYVPLDTTYPQQRLDFMLADSKAVLLLTTSEIASRFPQVETLLLDRFEWRGQAQKRSVELHPGHTAYVIYTSGSTGKAKGVLVTQRGLVNYLTWARDFYLTGVTGDVPLHTPIGFDLTVTGLWLPLAAGLPVRILPDGDAVEVVQRLGNHLAGDREGALVKLTPAHMEGLANLVPAERAALAAKRFIIGGEALRETTLEFWWRHAPNSRFINEYGPTEATVGCCIYDARQPAEAGGDVPIGRPIANMRLYAITESGQPVVTGEVGQLLIGGAGLARGYLNRPGLTAERFIPDHLSGRAGERLYQTGDLVSFLGDGDLKYLGRMDHQVKIHGHRIELGEIEACLATHARVREAAVIVSQHREGHAYLVAFVLAGEGFANLDEVLTDHLAGHLPEYMVPSTFVALDAFPMTANGKIDRAALAKIGPKREAEYVAPRNGEERILAETWAELLGVSRVGVHDNFFRLGGDSILAIMSVSRARARGLALNPKQVFDHQTIAGLAKALSSGVTIAAEQGLVTGEVPLTPIQQWFFELDQAAPHHFNQAFLFKTRRQLAEGPLRKALSQLVRHHDALRLRFRKSDGRWVQWHDAPGEKSLLTIHDLPNVATTEIPDVLHPITRGAQAGLNLSEGPLFAVHWVRFAEEARLLFVCHHLLVDGVSWRILLEDFNALFSDYAEGRHAELPPKTTAFQTWARRLTDLAKSGDVDTDQWRGSMEHFRPLPLDRAVDEPHAVNTVASQQVVTVRLPAGSTRELLGPVHSSYNTRINDFLVAALALTIARWQGSKWVTLDLEGHGRDPLFEDVDLTRTVGWFTAKYPVSVNAGTSPIETLKAAKDVLRGVAMGGLGYGLFRLDEGREAAPPEPDILFNYLGQVRQEDTGAWLEPAAESPGSANAPVNLRSHLLEINAIQAGDELIMHWAFSENLHDRATMTRLAEGYVQTLSQLIEAAKAGGGWTPSDFPTLKTDQASLDRLIEALPVLAPKYRQIESIHRLSPMQEGMLFQSAFEPDGDAYFEQVSATLSGVLNIAALKRAWEEVVARHGVLRTLFVRDLGGLPCQVTLKSVSLPAFRHDWREVEATQRSRRLEVFLAEDRRQGFELGQAPLMRIHLIELGEEKTHFVWSHHHLLLDGWSVAKVMGEVFTFYQAFRDGTEIALPTPKPFGNYLTWLDHQDPHAARDYWTGVLDGFGQPNTLAPQRRPRDLQAEWVEVSRHFGSDLTARLQQTARDWEVTVNSIVQAAWALLVGRYSDARDVVFGATVSGRPAALEGVETMVGLFINTLPVRVQLDGEPTVAELWRQLRDQSAQSDRFAYASLVDIARWSGIPHESALFESIFIFENYPVEKAMRQSDRGLAVSDQYRHEQTNFPLTVVVVPGADLLVRMSYDTSIYPPERIEGMLDHLHALLAGSLTAPQAAVSRLSMVPEAQRDLLLHGWNATAVPLDDLRPCHRQFEAQAEVRPSAPALSQGDTTLTYAQLNRRANQLAHHLLERGIGRDTIVAISMARCPETVVSLLAIFKAGAAYVPIDPELPASRKAFMVADTGARLVLTVGEAAGEFDGAACPVLVLDDAATQARLARDDGENPDQGIDADQLAYVIYTSGSTGQPKGVMVPHRGLINQLLWRIRTWTIGEGDRVLQNIPFSFDPSVWQICWPLVTGAELVLPEPGEHRDSVQMARLIAETGITVTAMVPSFLRVLLDEDAFCKAHLKHISCGGEALSVALQKRFVERTGRPEVLNVVYGPTEASIDAASQPAFTEGDPRLVHIGKPITNTTLHVLDRNMHLIPPGLPGELLIGGAGLARGYLARPGLTAEKFVPHPFAEQPGERLYRTGDLAAWLADGRLEFIGRIDHQVKIRGIRIELGEVETALSQCDGVVENVVLALDDPTGHGKRLVAFVQAEPDLDLASVEQTLAKRLSSHAVPARFVLMENLPLTASGKVDRQRLVSMPLPEEETPTQTPPRTEIEAILAGIWRDVLHIGELGIDDNFFALGGHSLTATQVASRIRAAFDVDLPIKVIFESPSVRGLAQNVATAQRGAALPPIEPVPRETVDAAGGLLHESLPLSFSQQRMWFLDRLEGPSATYNMPAALRLRGPLDLEAVARSVARLVDRHEALRTVFPDISGKPIAVVLRNPEVKPQILDLSDMPPDQGEVQGRRCLTEAAIQPFDLVNGPLFRVHIARLSSEDHLLLINLHHIVGDGWSVSVIVREWAELYRAEVSGEPARLPELNVQYVDFAQWQRQWLSGERLERLLDYWRRALENGPSVLELPLDRPRPAIQTFNGDEVFFEIDPSIGQRLEALARETGTTAFMVLLAAYYALLTRLTGQYDLMVGTPIANRTRKEVEPLVGVFINTLVLRGNTTGNPRFLDLLANTRRTALEAYAHQDLPFEKVIDAVAPERSTSIPPLYQTMFILQNTPEPGSLTIEGLAISPFGLADKTVAKCDLTMELTPLQGLQGRVEFNTDLFDRSTVELLIQSYRNLLTAIAADPATRIENLAWLDETARRKMVFDWNQTRRSYPREASLASLFETQAKRYPNRLVWECHGELPVAMNYRTLDLRAGQLARELRDRGVVPCQLIGVFCEPGPDLIVALVAILKAGGAYLPLDTDYPADRLDFMVADAGVTVLLKQGDLNWAGKPLPITLTLGEESGKPLDHGTSEVDGSFPAYVIYTSGSTGKPKGTVVAQRSVTRLVRDTDWVHIEPGDRIARCTNISFDVSTFELWGAMLHGATLVDVPKQIRLTPKDFKTYLEEQRVQILFLTPAVFSHTVRGAADAFTTIEQMFVGGEEPDSQTVAAMMHAGGPDLFANAYGPTENTTFSTWHVVAEAPVGGAPVPIGMPIANSTAHVVDSRMRLVPVGVPAELVLGGEGVANGYLNRPGLTACQFIPDPFSAAPGMRLYKTGDLVRRKVNGDIVFMGRIDHQVKLRGIRIELGEIESILRNHEDVRGAVCQLRGEPKRLVAYVLADEAGQPDFEGSLRTYLNGKLPEFMVPSAFVMLPEFPITPNGKLDRKRLPEPEIAQPETGDLPRTPVEETLAGIWAEVLGLERVGVHDNFFEMGGDSILSIQIVAKASEAGLKMTPQLLFGHQTVAALAPAVGTGTTVVADQGPVTGDVPLTPIMARFLEMGHPQPSHYNQTLLFSLPEDPDVLALSQALALLGRHHDALRLRFHRKQLSWSARCEGLDAAPKLQIIDLSETDDPPGRISEICSEVQASLDLERGPIARFVYFQLAEGESGRLLAAIHHLAVDGVSWRILLEDLGRAYQACRNGEQPRLPPKTTSFREWACRLEAYSGSQELARECSYWQACVADEEVVAPAAFTAAETSASFARLDRELTEALLKEVPAAFNTRIDDVLLTALARGIAGASGRQSLLVDLEGHGREQIFDDVDLTRTVGWFTSMYPVRLNCSLGEDPIPDLKRIKETLRAVPHKGIGYGLLRHVHPDRPVKANATVAFNYLGQMDLDRGESVLKLAPESPGPNVASSTKMVHPIELNAVIREGSLELHLSTFDGAMEEGAADRLVDGIRRELSHLVERCCADGAGGYTPSDFPLVDLDQDALDGLCGPGKGVEDLYPLTPMQEGMLFHALLDPHADPYVDQFSATIHHLDPEHFKSAWAWVIQRHAVLRTGFYHEDLEHPLQVVFKEVAPVWIERDWSDLTPGERAAELANFLEEEKRRGLPLDEAPLLRFALFRQGQDTYRFVLTQHHLVLDGWSMSRIMGDLFTAYSALSHGRRPQADSVPKYRDYVAWLQRQNREDACRYWQGELADFELATPLPGDKMLGPGGMAAHRETLLHCPETVTSSLNQLARTHRLTMNTLVQAAWALTLAQLNGLDDVCFGATVSGRPSALAGVSEMVGLFVNTLPVRVRLDGEATLIEWLANLQEAQVAREAFAHSRLVDVAAWSGVPKGEALFDSLVIFENFPVSQTTAPSGDGLLLEDVSFTDRNHLAISLTVSPGKRLSLRLGYDEARLQEADAMRMAHHFLFLLEAMTQAAQMPLRALPTQTKAEADRVIRTLNKTVTPLPEGCFPEIFEKIAEANPSKTAVQFGDQSLTYGELARKAKGVAAALLEIGAKPEDKVAVFLERGIELLPALLGSMMAGVAYVPMDPGFPADRIGYMLADARAVAVLSLEPTADDLPPLDVPVLLVDRLGERDAVADLPKLVPEQLAYTIYTSGSTGKPKAVQVTHGNLANFLWSMATKPGLTPGDTLTAVTTISFDIAGLELYLPLLAGARLVISDRETAMDGQALATLIAATGTTVVQATPTTWRLLLASDWPGGMKVLCGGEAFPPDLARDLLAKGCEVWNMYGPTETTIWSSVFPVRNHADTAGAQLPIGKPIANTTVYVLDRHARPAPLGSPGLLVIGGAGVARGYGGRPGLTAERFTPDPCADQPGSRLYHTGDLARWLRVGDTHQLEFLGRMDHQIKLRGYRIELGEIEAALIEDEAVRIAAVILAGRGEDRQLVACVETETKESDALLDRLRTALKAALPKYMVPAHFRFFERFPLTPNGKIDRKALASRIGDSEMTRAGGVVVEPRTLLEFDLRLIWEDVLGLSPIGVTDDFFELGGHSLTAVRLMTRIASRMGRRLRLSALFDGANVRDLATHFAQQDQAEESALVTLRQGEGTPLFLVHPAGGNVVCYAHLARALDGNYPIYAFQSATHYGAEAPETLQEQAAHYREMVEALNPEGPCRIVGWSLGSTVAYEMGRQLIERGREVAPLVLIDGFAPADMPPLRDQAQLMAFLSNRLLAGFGFRIHADELRGKDDLFQALIDRIQADRPELFEQVGRDWIRTNWTAGHANIVAALQYTMPPYPGGFTFIAAEDLPAGGKSPLAGWQGLARDGINLLTTPGAHDFLVYPPHVDALANTLNQLLNRVPSYLETPTSPQS